jgi:hypothetical protein
MLLDHNALDVGWYPATKCVRPRRSPRNKPNDPFRIHLAQSANGSKELLLTLAQPGLLDSAAKPGCGRAAALTHARGSLTSAADLQLLEDVVHVVFDRRDLDV